MNGMTRGFCGLALFVALATSAWAKDAQQLFFDGYELLQQGKASEAAARFEQGLALEPGNADAHYFLAEAYVALGKPDKAKAAFQKSLSLNVQGERATKARKYLQENAGQAQSTQARQYRWEGTYWYAPGSREKPVNFVLEATIEGSRLAGKITEPNTFGDPSAALLYARVEGTLTGRHLRFRKSYDGTGKVDHSVEYEGVMDANREVRGVWRISETTGRFELRPSP